MICDLSRAFSSLRRESRAAVNRAAGRLSDVKNPRPVSSCH